MQILKELATAVALGMVAVSGAHAQAYPNHPVTVIFPNPAGGSYHTMLLAMQPMIEKQIGQPLVVQTMPGGGTTIGTRFVANQPANGYTMLFIHEGAFLTGEIGTLGFRTLDRLDPVAQVTESCAGLFTRPDAPYSNLKELKAYAAKHPGKVRGGINVGTLSQVKMAAIADMLGVNIRPVPIGGGAKVRQAVLAGDVDLMVQPPASEAALVKASKEKAIAVSGANRSPELPNTPTIQQQGFGPLPLMCSGGFFWLRAKTPPKITEFWGKALTAVFTNPKNVQELKKKYGIDVDLVTGGEMQAKAKQLSNQLSAIVKRYKIGQN